MVKLLRAITDNLPEVKAPLRAPGLREKLIWTAGVLILFFIMGQIYPIGADATTIQGFERFEILLGSRTGTLITTGIGPIVLASIFLQLAVGAKLINLDLSNPENKKAFQGYQKLLAVFLSIVEGFIYSKAVIVATDVIDPATGIASAAFFAQNAIFGIITPMQIAIMLQLALGSVFLLYMDEVCQKYGIGSGVSLFIAAGVAQAIFVGTFGFFGLDALGLISTVTSGEPAGIIPGALYNFTRGDFATAIWMLFPLIFTIVVFLITVFAEGMKIELPLAYGGARGLGARYPIKFLYVSNIPVILASALLLNVQVVGLFMNNAGFPLLGAFGPDNRPLQGLEGGFAYLTSALPSPILLVGGYSTYVTNYLLNPTELLHILVYGIVLVLLCIVFGWFWIESTGMGPEKVAAQLNRTGLQIPGYRQDPRITEKILQKYIPIITVLGSIFVGVLAWFADITGALGTGTGILLTVGILYRFYEDLAQQQIFEMYPVLKRIAG